MSRLTYEQRASHMFPFACWCGSAVKCVEQTSQASPCVIAATQPTLPSPRNNAWRSRFWRALTFALTQGAV